MALDEDDLKKVAELIASEQEKATKATLKVIGEQLKPVISRIEAVEKTATAKPDDQPDDEPDEGRGASADPEVKALKAKMAALEARAQKAEQDRREAEEKAKAERLQQAARDALLAAGVPADRVKAALATLQVDGLLDYDDQGQPGIKFQRQGYAEVLTGKDGAAEWLKSDVGKIFLPPADVGGTGERSGRRPGPKNTGQPVDGETLARNLFARAFGG